MGRTDLLDGIMIWGMLWTISVWVVWLVGAVAIVASLQTQREDIVTLMPSLTSPFRGTMLDRIARERLDWQRVFLPVVRVVLAFVSFFFAFLYQASEFVCGVCGAVAKVTGEWARMPAADAAN